MCTSLVRSGVVIVSKFSAYHSGGWSIEAGIESGVPIETGTRTDLEKLCVDMTIASGWVTVK